MQSEIIRAIGLVASSAILGGCLIAAFRPVQDDGRWVSVGTGTMTFNSKTDERHIYSEGKIHSVKPESTGQSK